MQHMQKPPYICEQSGMGLFYTYSFVAEYLPPYRCIIRLQVTIKIIQIKQIF